MDAERTEKGCSCSFQNILVRHIKEVRNSDYSDYYMIFATSMIAPELKRLEFTIGENYTRENKFKERFDLASTFKSLLLDYRTE